LQRDVDEAMRIAKRSEMRLFQCDADLEYARLALANGDRQKARGHVAEARRLVEETGYGAAGPRSRRWRRSFADRPQRRHECRHHCISGRRRQFRL